MHPCVYTTDKIKKSKKWIDGFVEKKGKGLILYDEDKRIVSTQSYFTKREDLNIETGGYLIYIDDSECFLGEEVEKEQVEDEHKEIYKSAFKAHSSKKEELSKASDHKEKPSKIAYKKAENESAIIDENQQEETLNNDNKKDKIVARTTEDILNLLGK